MLSMQSPPIPSDIHDPDVMPGRKQGLGFFSLRDYGRFYPGLSKTCRDLQNLKKQRPAAKAAGLIRTSV